MLLFAPPLRNLPNRPLSREPTATVGLILKTLSRRLLSRSTWPRRRLGPLVLSRRLPRLPSSLATPGTLVTDIPLAGQGSRIGVPPRRRRRQPVCARSPRIGTPVRRRESGLERRKRDHVSVGVFASPVQTRGVGTTRRHRRCSLRRGGRRSEKGTPI